jgi:hypothetical protein
LVAEERIGRLVAEPGLDAMDGKVHVGEAPRRGIALLPEDRYVGALAAVGLDELFRLDEHASAAARIVPVQTNDGREEKEVKPAGSRGDEDGAN